MVHSSPNITLEEGAAPLLRWYDACRRPFPWRETNDPYAVWISEVMLQQTQAARGVEYHRRWMRTFPTLRSLAEAKDAAADQEGKQPAAVQGGTPDTTQTEHDAALHAKAADGVHEDAAAVADDKADGKVVAAVAGGEPDTTQAVEKAALTASAATGVHEEAAAKADDHADGKVVAAVQSVGGATVQTVATDAALRGKAIESVKDPIPYWFKR